MKDSVGQSQSRDTGEVTAGSDLYALPPFFSLMSVTTVGATYYIFHKTAMVVALGVNVTTV